ncbi:hypothetical protein BH11GEM2_BH11GEM2_24250 [soil metagenome]
MRARERIPAVLAGATRTRLRTRTGQTLAEPEGKTLLADASRTVKEQRARKGVSANCIVEALAEQLMAMNGKQRHPRNLRRNTDATNPTTARIVTIRT